VPPGLISIQLWTVRDALWGPPGFDATLTAIADIGYLKVEQALGYFGRTAAQLRAF
jgi:sugar phosphate isomerase/epimerase